MSKTCSVRLLFSLGVFGGVGGLGEEVVTVLPKKTRFILQLREQNLDLSLKTCLDTTRAVCIRVT